MEDSEKTKEQLINELANLGQQVTKLKESEIKRKKAEEDLKKSQQEFVSLFKSCPEALVYADEKGNILNINPHFTALFGYTLKKIKGRNIDDEMIIPPDKMKEAKKLTSKALKEDFYFETVRKKKNGTLFPVAISGSRVIIGGRFKGLIASYRDITEHQKMIEDLKNSEEKYRSLYENMPGVYYRADREGNILMVNPPGAKLLGCNSPEEIIGKNIAKDLYYIPEDRKRFLEELKKRKGSVKDYEVILKRRDGTPVTVSTSSHYCYDEKGNIIGVEGIFVDITERKEAEMAIIYEQSLLHALMDNISDSVYFKDKEKRFIRVNKVKAERSEVAPEEMIGKTDFDFFPPEIAKHSFADDSQVIEFGKSIIDKVEKIIYLNKKEIWVSTTKVPWYDKEGRIIGIIGITRDITERVQAEKFQKVLYNISRAVNSSMSLKQLYKTIHKELSTIIDTTNFYIALIDEKEDKIFFPYNIDNTKPIHLPRTINHNSLVAQVIRTGKSTFVNREMIEEKEFMTKFKEWFGMLRKVWLGVPLKVEDKTIGAMVVQSYTNPNLYSKKDIKLMEFVSSQIAIAIERKQTEEALRKSNQEFTSLFKNSPEALAYLDKDSNIIDINPRFAELFNYTLEEVKGRNLDDGMIHPPEKMKEGKWLTKKSLKGRFYYETVRKKKDGTRFPIAISVSQVIIDGQLTGMIGIFQDITERKKIEKKLEELAHYDALAGCYGRGYGLALLEQQIKTANRKKISILLLYLDIDGFKEINDTFGHKEGDMILKDVGQLFKSTLREVDIICRMGGDEFLLIFPESSLNEIPLIRERLSKNLEKLNQKLGKPYKIDFSVGFSNYDPSNPLSIDELIIIADENMYEEKKSKNKGR